MQTKRLLNNRVAIVTGASSGLGAAVAMLLAQQQVKLMLTARRAAPLQQLTSNGSRDNINYLVGDIGNSQFCQQLANHCQQTYGRVDFLINCAGTIDREPLTSVTDAEWQRVMRTNVDAVFYLCRASIPLMPAGGSIVNIASTVSNVGAANLVSYCASKGAIANFTKALAIELAPKEITVNAIAPGAINTAMLASEHPVGTSIEQVIATNVASIPQGRIAETAEVARGILFLLQETHLTGSILAFDGGYTAQ